MEPSSEQLLALAEQLKSLAQDLATSDDPKSKKVLTASLVQEAKNLIWAAQDPLDHLMDQIVNVSRPECK